MQEDSVRRDDQKGLLLGQSRRWRIPSRRTADAQIVVVGGSLGPNGRCQRICRAAPTKQGPLNSRQRRQVPQQRS